MPGFQLSFKVLLKQNSGYRIMSGEVGEDMIEAFVLWVDVIKFAVVDFEAFVDQDHAAGHRLDFLEDMG